MSSEPPIPTMTAFCNTLGLDIRLTKSLQRLGYTHPTLVQNSAVPLLLDGKDVLMQSDTGTGKTVGYLVPFLESVLRSNGNQDGESDGEGERRGMRGEE